MLYNETRALIDAELSFQRNRASFIGKQAKRAGAMLLIGVTFIIGSMLALILGGLLALAPLVGPWGAMGIVVVLCLVVAMLAFRAVTGRVKAIGRVLGGEPKSDAGDQP